VPRRARGSIMEERPHIHFPSPNTPRADFLTETTPLSSLLEPVEICPWYRAQLNDIKDSEMPIIFYVAIHPISPASFRCLRGGLGQVSWRRASVSCAIPGIGVFATGPTFTNDIERRSVNLIVVLPF
jgi:hypothetical protein